MTQRKTDIAGHAAVRKKNKATILHENSIVLHMYMPHYVDINWCDRVSFLPFKTTDDNLVFTLTAFLTDWIWLQNISITSSPWPRPGRPGTVLKQRGARPVRPRLLLLSLFLARPTVSVKRKHPDECGWKTQRRSWCNRRKTRGRASGRKSIMWAKHGIHLGQLLFCACVCVCARAYIRGLNSLRWYINIHDADGEAGRRVSVSQHTHITPPLSLSPFHQSFLLLLSSPPPALHLSFFMLLLCVFSWGKHRGFYLAGKLWPPVGVRQVRKKCKQNKTINYTFTKQPF